MKRNRFFTAIGLITAVWFSACTNDEPMDPNALPEGKYPLEIASVTMSVTHSSEPWSADAPQTRVTESENGNSSVWEWDGTEKIGVQFGSEQVTYTLEDGQSLTPSKQLYWQNKEDQSLTAWYPAYEGGNGTIDLSNQTDALVYVLRATETATFNNPVTLDFHHQLAKVRVVLEGVTCRVDKVEINNYTSCSFNTTDGTVTGNTSGYIAMKRCNYSGIGECWEANVVPGTVDGNALVRLNGTTAVNITGISSFEVGSLNTITVSVTAKGEISIQSITVSDWPVDGEHTLTRAETDGSAWTWQSDDQVALNITPYNGTLATYALTYGNDARWTASPEIGEMLLPATMEAWWPSTASASDFSFSHDNTYIDLYGNQSFWLNGTVNQSSEQDFAKSDWMTSGQINLSSPSLNIELKHRLCKVTVILDLSEYIKEPTITGLGFITIEDNKISGTSAGSNYLFVNPLQHTVDGKQAYSAIISNYMYWGGIYPPLMKLLVNGTPQYVSLPNSMQLTLGNAYTLREFGIRKYL